MTGRACLFCASIFRFTGAYVVLLPHDAILVPYILWLCVCLFATCLSVRPSITSRYCGQTDRPIHNNSIYYASILSRGFKNITACRVMKEVVKPIAKVMGVASFLPHPLCTGATFYIY